MSQGYFQKSDEPLTAEILAKRFGYMTPAEVRMLQYCANYCVSVAKDRTPIFINVGAGAGTSTLAMRERSMVADIYSVDISSGGPLGGFEGETNAFKQAFMHPKYHPIQILGDSGEVAKTWRHEDADLIFIDDGHNEEDITRDITSWWPVLKIGGIIAFHDYGAEAWPAVAKAVDELVVNATVFCAVHTFRAFIKKGH